MPFTCVMGLNGVNQDWPKKALWKKQKTMMSRELPCLFKFKTNLVPVQSAELQLIFKGAKAEDVRGSRNYIHVFRSYFHYPPAFKLTVGLVCVCPCD